MPCVERRVVEHDPGGEDGQEGQYQHRAAEMGLIPVIKRLGHKSHVFPIIHTETELMEIHTIAEALEVREQPMEDDRIGDRENEQHLHRRKTHLALAADVVTDEVVGATATGMH